MNKKRYFKIVLENNNDIDVLHGRCEVTDSNIDYVMAMIKEVITSKKVLNKETIKIIIEGN